MQKITPFLWFEDGAEKAVAFYTSVFPDAKVIDETKLPENVPGPKGKVLIATLELLGQQFILLNGGPNPAFTFSPAISFVVTCEDQAEIDYYWEKLAEGGGITQQCGWLRDQFGISWQIVPKRLGELMSSTSPEVAQKVSAAMLQMTKLDIALLEAAAGE